jgi:superfamily II DNA/RNA helicase
MTFADLGLSPETLKAVAEVGYDTPTPIQTQAIPHVLMGRDVLGIAQTGTGKTASFTLPMIEVLASGRPKARMPRSLILAPTRELATQVSENFSLYGKYHKLTMALLIGGESMNEQQKLLDRGVDVLIATPGRLIDLFERGSILLRDVKILVIDEADRMLDMGFIPDVERIVGLLPPLRQTLFFSATMDPEIKRLADAFLMNPKEIRVEPTRKAADTVEQGLVTVKAFDKREAIRHLLRREEVSSAFIFCNRKRDVDVLERSLKKHGFDAVALHGDMPQYVRTERLERFKKGEITLLVCSDVAARGIDVTEISHVFNFDVPSHAEDYVHRIGRTGRAGKTGRAYTIATPEDAKYLRAIETLLGKPIPPTHLEEIAELSGGAEDEGEVAPQEERAGRRNRRNRGRKSEDGSSAGEEAKSMSNGNGNGSTNSAGNGGGNGNAPGAASSGNGPGPRSGGNRKNDRSSGRNRRRGRWDDDPQNDVMDMDIGDDVIGFGGYTPAFLLEAPVHTPMDDSEDADEAEDDLPVVEDEQPKRKRTPRKKKAEETAEVEDAEVGTEGEAFATEDDAPEAEGATTGGEVPPVEDAVVADKPKRKRAPRKKKAAEDATPAEGEDAEAVTEDAPVEDKPKRKRAPRKKKVADEAAPAEGEVAETATEDAPAEDKPKRKRAPRKRATKTEVAELQEDAPVSDEPQEDAPASAELQEDAPASAELQEDAPASAELQEDVGEESASESDGSEPVVSKD